MNDLAVLLVNCHSIKNKTDLVAPIKPNIVIGSEHWLGESIEN